VPIAKERYEDDDKKLEKSILQFDRSVADWRKDIETPLNLEEDHAKFIRPVELGVKNAYVFWVNSPQDRPVTMALYAKSCTCSDVDCSILSSEAWTMYQRQMALTAAIPSLAFTQIGPAAVASLLGSAKWEKLPGFESPPPLPELRPIAKDGTPGMIRVNFQPKNLSASNSGDTLTIAIRGEFPGVAPEDKELVVKYQVLPEMGYLPRQTVDVGEIAPGGNGKHDILVWSMTREVLNPQLSITGPDIGEMGHPCFEIDKPDVMVAAEIVGLEKLLVDQFKVTNTVTCGRRFRVTVHEKRGGRQLDIGPFQRTLLLKSEGSIEPHRIPLTGVVRGEVRLYAGGDERDRIVLGNFHHSVTKSVTLEAPLEVDLKIDETATSRLFKSELKNPTTADGKKRWQLIVEVPDDTLAGDLPPGTAVVLDVKGTAPRKMRIPVTGTAAR
jgi:hypothetical protein